MYYLQPQLQKHDYSEISHYLWLLKLKVFDRMTKIIWDCSEIGTAGCGVPGVAIGGLPGSRFVVVRVTNSRACEGSTSMFAWDLAQESSTQSITS